jgi:hypothetical protein
MRAVRTVLGTELEKILPTDVSAVLTDAQRIAAYDQLMLFGAVLKEVK